MPALTFPISPDGLVVPALLDLGSKDRAGLVLQGTPTPPPIPARALIDTGTDVTAFCPRLITALGALPVGSATTQTATALATIRFYQITLTVHDPIRAGAQPLIRSDWVVTDLPVDLPNIDVLIGLDLIRQITTTIDGPGGLFALIF